jgi:sec-independent protein translocase protein TatC
MTEAKMPLMAHLGELRKRILLSAAAIFVAFFVAFSFAEELFAALMFPLNYSLDFSIRDLRVGFVPDAKLASMKLIFTKPAEAFWMSMKVSFVAGIVLSLPFLFFQVWQFIAPGLQPKEKRYVLPFVFGATVLFLFGASFCFFGVLPVALSFLLGYTIGGILMPFLSVGEYVDFCLKFIIAFGAIFELPVFIIFFTRAGIITTATLRNYRRHAFVLAFIIAAILTPTPDWFNQILMAVPIIILYEVGIWVSTLFEKKRDG